MYVIPTQRICNEKEVKLLFRRFSLCCSLVGCPGIQKKLDCLSLQNNRIKGRNLQDHTRSEMYSYSPSLCLSPTSCVSPASTPLLLSPHSSHIFPKSQIHDIIFFDSLFFAFFDSYHYIDVCIYTWYKQPTKSI